VRTVDVAGFGAGAVQNAPSSLSPDIEAQHLTAPVSSDTGGHDHRLGHDAVIYRALQ